ncbi:MAG: nitroreductase family protein [Actinobacteria bacterium]|nr:nitroreductase family protein [Actinomycetota bacterium]
MALTFDLTQTDHLLTTTRAVRKRLDLTRPVPRDLILDCIRIATQAPAGGNVQMWRWLVVDDPELKRGLADLYRRSYEPYIAAQRASVEQSSRTDIHAIMSSSDHLAAALQDVPALVVPCQLGRVDASSSQGTMAGMYGSILPAVWSFMLAARSRGLGTAWTTLHLAYEQEAAELLGIPANVTQVALTPVAYYTGDDFKPGSRLPAERVTYFNRWKQTIDAPAG